MLYKISYELVIEHSKKKNTAIYKYIDDPQCLRLLVCWFPVPISVYANRVIIL